MKINMLGIQTDDLDTHQFEDTEESTAEDKCELFLSSL